MPDPTQLLLGLAVPLLIAAVLAWIGNRFTPSGSWGALVGLAIGLAVAYRAFMSRALPWPAVEAPERIVAAGVVLALIALLAGWRRVPWPVHLLLAIVFQVAILWYVFRPIPESVLPANKMWTWIGVAAAIGLVLTFSTEALAHRPGGVAAALAVGPLAAGVGAINILTGNAKLGWLGASLGVIVFGWFVAALCSRAATLARGPIIVVMAIVSGLLAYGYFASDSMTTLELVLLPIAPLLAWLAELPPLQRWRDWRQELIRLILVAIPIGIVVGIAVPRFIHENSSSDSAMQEM
jgi:hypothetical protein